MEENKETVDNEVVDKAVGTQANENKDEGKAERTYTQEEYNALDRKLKAKYEKKYEGIDLKAYNEWVESQKTAEQKQAEKDAEYAQKDTTISELQKENAVLKAGVKDADDIEFVLWKVGKMEGDFEENLIKFLKDNPKYTKGEELTEPKATGAPVKSIGSTESGVKAILKAKHQNLFEE